ncbi:MAG TPA: hypothetical protein VFS97_03960 [Nitrososphaeraceae archaeon]|nr:hypothetical protein [Nitrososphaeraceae archaeon]
MVTTKYTKKHSRRGLDSRENKVVIAESDDEIKEYVCDSCNFIIHTRLTDGEITCLHCENVIEIQKTRRKSKLETPHQQNTETLVSSVPTPGFGDVKIKKEPELKGGFLALQQKGLRIKDYQEYNP